MPPTRDDEDDDDELTSPFDMIRSVPRTAAGHSATPKAPDRPSEVVDVLPGKTRIVFACMLPLLMIAATFAVQKKVMLNAGHAHPTPTPIPLLGRRPHTYFDAPRFSPGRSHPNPNPDPNPNANPKQGRPSGIASAPSSTGTTRCCSTGAARRSCSPPSCAPAPRRATPPTAAACAWSWAAASRRARDPNPNPNPSPSPNPNPNLDPKPEPEPSTRNPKP